MFSESAGYLYVNRGGKFLKQGTITVYEQGLEQTDSDIQYEIKSIQKAVLLVQKLAQSLPSSGVTNSLIRDLLQESTLDHYPYPNYTIYNTNSDNEEICIGKINNGKINITEPLYLPGGVQNFSNKKVKLNISISTGFFTDGQQDFLSYLLQQGAIQFLPFVNQDSSVLQNFQLVYNKILCATENFTYDYHLKCMQKEDLDLFFICSPRIRHIETVYQVLKDTNRLVPIIGFLSNIFLISKVDFPYLLFVYSDLDPLYSIMATVVNYFGWKNILVIDSDLQHSQNLPYFVQYCKSFGIKIHNDQDKRIFPAHFRNSSILEQYSDWYQHYKETNIRILVLYGDPIDLVYILQGFLNNGFRPGDLVIVAAHDLNYLLRIVQDPQVLQTKQLQLFIQGSLSFRLLEYNTQYSRQVMDVLYQKLHTDDISTTGYTIDSLLLGVYAIDQLMNFGRDFTNLDILNESMRVQRFWGSTGLFQIDSSYNTRRDPQFEFGYIQTKNGNQQFEKIGSYKILGNPPLEIYQEPLFYNESKIPPWDFRQELWECNFYKKDIREAQFSKDLTSTITLSLILVFFFLSGCLSIKQIDKDIEIQSGETQAIMDYEDLIILLYIVYESLIVLFLGPDFSGFNPFLFQFGSYFVFMPEYFFSKHTQQFWIQYNLVLGFTGLWLLLYGLNLFLNTSRLLSFSQNYFQAIYSKIMPLIAYLFFVPIVSLLLVIIKCQQASGPQIEDTLLYNDCNTLCWQQTHLLYSIFSLFAVFLFILSVFHFRLKFTSSIYTNIQQSNKFVVLNTFFLLHYITLNFILKENQSELFNAVYMLYLIGFVIYLSLFRVYNYKRTQIIHSVASRIVLVSIILTVVFTSFSAFGLEERAVYLFVTLEISGWVLVIALGVFSWKKSPPMYKYKKTYKTVYSLFRFMLGRIGIRKLSTHLNTLYFPQRQYQVQEQKQRSDQNFIGNEQ